MFHPAVPDADGGVALSGGLGFIAPLYSGAQVLPAELLALGACDPVQHSRFVGGRVRFEGRFVICGCLFCFWGKFH